MLNGGKVHSESKISVLLRQKGLGVKSLLNNQHFK